MDTEPLLQFFRFRHLPAPLQAVSWHFARQALDLVDKVPSNPERTKALRNLLLAKDNAVRAVLYKDFTADDLAQLRAEVAAEILACDAT